MLSREENDQRLAKIWADVQIYAPTDAMAQDVFYEYWKKLGMILCPDCSSDNIRRVDGERECECLDCGMTSWFTSGTLLSRVKLFKSYLAASLLFEAGLTISGPQFSKLTGTPQTSAYTILRKFRMAISNQMSSDAEQFSGQLVRLLIAKRTLETPANSHPFVEQELIDEALQNDLANNIEPAGASDDENFVDGINGDDQDENLSEYEKVKKVVLSLLSDVGLTADTISLRTGFAIGKVTGSLSELELFGEARVEPGGKYFKGAPAKQSQSQIPLTETIIIALTNFYEFVIEYFHRVGRKGLQTYVAALWCTLDRERWGRGSVMHLCGTHPPVTYREILNYVSPPLLNIIVG